MNNRLAMRSGSLTYAERSVRRGNLTGSDVALPVAVGQREQPCDCNDVALAAN
jgi:hypothetical protein